jgi:glycosyltransferase involved in cell wall biosynthesis
MAPLYNIGGIEEWLRDIAKELHKRGHEITICTTNYLPNSFPKSFLAKRIQTILNDVRAGCYEYKVFKNVAKRNLVLNQDFLKLLNKMDVAYFENFAFSSLSAFVPIIFGFHVPFQLSSITKIFLTLHKMKRIPIGFHVLNPVDYLYLKNFLAEIRLKKAKLFLVPNGVDCNKFHPGAGTLDESKFRILFVGRLTREKGVDILPYILHELKNLQKNLELTIIGPDMGMGHVVNRMINIFPKEVRYLGCLPREILPRLYASSHVTLLPSRVERFPLVSLESMACGTPVLTSNLANFRYILEPLIKELNVNFIIENSEDVSVLGKRFAERIIKLLADERYQELRKAVRKYVMERFCWNKVVLDFEYMLRSITNMQ